jgi:hypothetical protein
MKTGLVRIKGRFTKEEKAIWDHVRGRKAECIEIIAEHEQTLRDDPNCEYADILRDEIKHERKLLGHIRTVIKD